MPWPLSVVCSKSLNLSGQGNVGFTAGPPLPVGHSQSSASVCNAAAGQHRGAFVRDPLQARQLGVEDYPLQEQDHPLGLVPSGSDNAPVDDHVVQQRCHD